MSSVYQAGAYIYVCVDIYNSFDPNAVRFDHKGIRPYALRFAIFHVSLYLLKDMRAMVSTVPVASL